MGAVSTIVEVQAGSSVADIVAQITDAEKEMLKKAWGFTGEVYEAKRTFLGFPGMGAAMMQAGASK